MRYLLTAILCLFYLLGLLIDRSFNVLFGLLLLFGLVSVAIREPESKGTYLKFTKQHRAINVAMAAPLLAVLMHMLFTGNFDWRSMDFPSRLALFTLAFWAVQFVPLSWMRRMQWAFVIGAVAGAAKMYLLTDDGQIRYMTDFIPLNIFAEMVLLFGIFAASSLAWENRAGFIGASLKVMAFGAVLYAVYLSGTRGAWLTFPVLLVLAYVFLSAHGIRFRYVVAAAAVSVACSTIVWQAGGILKERVAMAASDIQQYVQGTNIDTSVGIRLQLWRASWIMFEEHPVVGVGAPGFRPALGELAARKVISPMAASFTHSHNDMLFMVARYGVFGLIAILALYGVPGAMFSRRFSDPDKEIRSCAYMGTALVVGLMILGLTDVAFTCWEIAPFYAVTIAFLLSYIEKREKYLNRIG
ncbi:MAG: O-antigen ligase family protein [Burkholderiaceae bacterium]